MFLKQQPQKSKAWPCIHIAGSIYPDIFTAKVNLNTCFYVTEFFKAGTLVVKKLWCYTYLLLLLVEVVNDDPDEEVEGEEGAKDDEEHEVDVHVDVHLAYRLFTNLNMFCCVHPLRIGESWYWKKKGNVEKIPLKSNMAEVIKVTRWLRNNHK